MRYEWQEDKAARGITLDDVKEVFSDPYAADIYDEAHSIDEERYYMIGLCAKGLLTVVYTVRQEAEEVIRVITAWHATASEEKIYERKR